MSADTVRVSVGQLLSRAYTLPCNTAAQAFTQIVPPIARFQLALDVLLPLLDSSVELQQRILVAYILYSLYAPHPIAINPFQTALVSTFNREKEIATRVAAAGGVGDSEQLVWVLWKILRGDGSDIGPFTPSNLARSPVPPKLRAENLSLEVESERLKFDPFGDSFDIDPAVPSQKAAGDAGFPNVEHEVSTVRDEETARLSAGMSLLLAARDRVLTLAEQRLTSPPVITSVDLAPIISNNPALAFPLVRALLAQPSGTSNTQAEETLSTYLEVLKQLPPTLPSFDLFGNLLRDGTPILDLTTGGRTTIADLIRTEVLGWFIHECTMWLDKAEQDEKEGAISDDRFAKGLSHLCRFYASLIKLGIVDPSSDADSTEMMHFTLRNARFEDANALYRILVMGKF
ncbi:hypothetical protein C8Q75DRAFT_793480 [Abortiporus biennis]|nr:hypothetical protein C8Q75DRAFT_793480 [Abortiporus biennis]